MQIRYGSYTHTLGEPALTIDRQTLYTDAQSPYAETVRWMIQGMLTNQGGTEATLNAKVRALEAAYAWNNKDAALLLTSGGAAAGHTLINADTIGGVRVVKRPHYPKGDGAEGITMRTFAVVLEATFPLTSGTALLSWTETISFSGGGASYGFLEPLTGRPIKQKLKQRTTYHATQQGRAVGLYEYPTVPSAMWTAGLLGARETKWDSPKRMGYGSGADTHIGWPVSWLYKFASDNPMYASGPNRWLQ